jgi:hypothetical protein
MIKQNIPNMPNMPNMADMPGMGAMADTLEFVKNLWGGMGLPGMNMSGMSMPGMVIPTLSVDEIQKKVSDLKAVETWLELNMNMLRSTIQALEVQAATIATLQSMGDALSATMKSAGATASAGERRQNGQQKPAAAASLAPSSKPGQKTSGTPEPASRDEVDASSLMTAPLVNAAAWWNLLQSQFNQAMSNAMTTEVPVAGANGSDKARGNGRSSSNSSPSSAKSESASAPPRKRGRRASD